MFLSNFSSDVQWIYFGGRVIFSKIFLNIIELAKTKILDVFCVAEKLKFQFESCKNFVAA